MGPGILGDMFDFNRDGRLDSFEQAAELSFLTEVTREEIQDSPDEDFLDDIDYDIDEDY